MKNNFLVKSFLFTLCIIFLVSQYPDILISQASAASFDLSVSPSIFQIELSPPAVADVKETLTLENNSDEPLPLTLRYRPFRPSGDNGELIYLKENESPGNDPLIFQRISVLDNGKRLESFIIPPKTKKQYDLAISIPKDEPPGDYYFSILFVSQNGSSLDLPLPKGEGQEGEGTTPPKNQGSSSTALGGVATNILLSIGPKTKTTGAIEDFSTSLFQPEGPVAFNVKIKNTSSHFIYPKARILITNMFGQTIGKVDLLPVNVLSNSVRSLPSIEQFAALQRLEDSKQGKTKEDKETLKTLETLETFNSSVAIWPEKFLLGPYTATLTVAFSDEGPLYTRSILFIGLPVYIGAGFAIAIILLLAIRTRLKHHQKI